MYFSNYDLRSPLHCQLIAFSSFSYHVMINFQTDFFPTIPWDLADLKTSVVFLSHISWFIYSKKKLLTGFFSVLQMWDCFYTIRVTFWCCIKWVFDIQIYLTGFVSDVAFFCIKSKYSPLEMRYGLTDTLIGWENEY